MVKITEKGVIGIDEVGRGPLAGPVTVCAVYIMKPNFVKKHFFHSIVRDSKTIKKSLRNNIYLTIRKNRIIDTTIKYSIKSTSASYIDRYGIQKATQRCIDLCMHDLLKQGAPVMSCIVRTDAGIKVQGMSVRQKSFVKGDERFTEIALASILAKETRDRYMKKLARTYPTYGWEKNVGYGTSKHRNAIRKNGITKYHRTSYLKAFKLFDKSE